jgi:hypothetical protein
MQMIFLTCMDLSEQEKSGRWKHGGIAGIRIRGDMVKNGPFPMKPFGAFTRHRCPEKCSRGHFPLHGRLCGLPDKGLRDVL